MSPGAQQETADSAQTPERFSAMALWSFLIAIASVGACLLAAIVSVVVDLRAAATVLVLPLFSLAGAVMGGIALLRIERSGGRLGGRRAALIGLFLGLIATIIQGATAGGALAAYFPVKRHIAPTMESALRAAAAGDLTTASALLGTGPGTGTGEERISRFLLAIEDRLGPWVEVRFDIGVLAEAAREVRLGAARASAAAQPGGDLPKPVVLVHARGAALAFLYPDQAALGRRQVRIVDALVILPHDASAAPDAVALSRDGPAAALGKWLGANIIE